MAGDSVLAVFDIATGAVSAAIAIQQELNAPASSVSEDRRKRIRIGVHMDDAIERADGTVYGGGANIAARLEGLAEPGGITVSDSVRNAVKGRVVASSEDQLSASCAPTRTWLCAENLRYVRASGGGCSGLKPRTTNGSNLTALRLQL